MKREVSSRAISQQLLNGCRGHGLACLEFRSLVAAEHYIKSARGVIITHDSARCCSAVPVALHGFTHLHPLTHSSHQLRLDLTVLDDQIMGACNGVIHHLAHLHPGLPGTLKATVWELDACGAVRQCHTFVFRELLGALTDVGDDNDMDATRIKVECVGEG